MADIESNIRVSIDTANALANIKALQREISAFQTSMAKGSATQANVAKQLENNLVGSINATQNFSARITKVASTTEAFTTALEKNRLSLGQYFRYSAAATKSFGSKFQTEFNTIDKVARERVKTLQTQYIKLGRDASGAMRSIAIRPLTLDMDDLGTRTAIAAQKQQLFNQLMRQGSTNLLNFGKNTQWAGRQLMVGFTIPLSIFGTMAAKSFMKLEEQAIKFKKVYGDLFTSDQERDKALSNINAIADGFTKYGVAVADTVGLAAEAAAAGFGGADLEAQTREATKLSVLGQLDQQKALETTISLQNAFKLSSEELADSINFLNAVENQTVVALDDITTAIPKVAPVIQALGGDVKDLSFFLAAMKEGGVNASEGANALKSSLGRLINPTQAARDMMRSLGIDIVNIVESNAGNLKQTMLDLGSSLDTLDPLNRARAIEELFGKFQFARMSTLFDNINREGNQASRVLDLAANSAEELASISEKELGMTAASAMNQFRGAVEQLQKALAPVGETFLKIATPLVNFATDVLNNFNNLNAGVKTFVAGLVGLLGVVGPIALMTFGLLANGVANLIKLFISIRTGFKRTGDSSQMLGEQVSYMTQEQLTAAGVAASLDQAHQSLTQRFTSEAAAIDKLTAAYGRAISKQRQYTGPGIATTIGKPKGYAQGGMIEGPGSGTSDSIPAMVSNGEFIVSAKRTKQYLPLLQEIAKGNVPGFASISTGGSQVGGSRGLFKQSSMFGSSGEYSAQASHFDIFAPSAMGETLKELKNELDGFVADVFIIGDKLEDGTHEVTKITEQLSNVADSNRDISSGGQTYSGTTTIESRERNQAYNAAGIAGAPFTLESVVDAGNKAEAALRSNSKESQKYSEQLRQLVEEGKIAQQKLRSGNAAQEKLTFMRNNSEKALYESYLSDTKVKSTSEARAMAQSKLAEIEEYIATLQASGIDEEQLLQKAKAKYAAELIKSGTGQFVSGPRGTGGNVVRDVATGRGRGTLTRVDRKPGERKFAKRGRSTAAVSSATYTELRAAGKSSVQAAISAIAAGARQALKIASPSKETKKIGQQAGQGFVDGAKNTIKNAESAGKMISQAVAQGVAQGASQSQQISSGVYRLGGRRVTTDTALAAASIGPRVFSPDKDATGLGLLDPVAKKAAFNLDSMNQKLMSASFAFMSINSIASMTGNGLGEFGEVVNKATMGLFALTGVIELARIVNLKKIAEDLRESGVATAKNTAGALGQGFKKLLGDIIRFKGFFGRLIPLVGLAITAFTVFKLIADAEKKRKQQIDGLGEAANVAGDSMSYLAEKTGIVAANLDRPGGFSKDGAANVEVPEESRGIVEQLKEDNENFKTAFESQIVAIKAASKEAGEATLAAMALDLQNKGYAPEIIATVIDMIVEEAGKTNLDLSFLVDVDGKLDESKLKSSAQDLVNQANAAIEKAASEKKTVVIAGVEMSSEQPRARSQGDSISDKALALAKAAGSAAGSQLNALDVALEGGTITAAEFNDEVSSLISNLSSIDPTYLSAGIESAAAAFGEDFVEALDSVNTQSDKLLLLQAEAANVDFASGTIDQLNAGGRDAILTREGLRRAIDAQAKALENLNEEEAQAEQVRLNTADIDTEIEKNEKITQVYNDLISAKFDEAEAYAIATDEKWSMLAAEAIEAGTLEELISLRNEYNDSVANLPTESPTAAIEKSIDALQEQIQVYDWLIENGYEAADARIIIGNADLYAAASATVFAAAAGDIEGSLPSPSALSNSAGEIQRFGNMAASAAAATAALASPENFRQIFEEFQSLQQGFDFRMNTGGSGDSQADDPYENVLSSLKNLRDASVVTSGKFDQLNKTIGSGSKLNIFSGVQNQLIAMGANGNFVDWLLGQEDDIKKQFMTVKDGIASLTKQGLQAQRAFNEINIGEVFLDAQQQTRVVRDQQTAIKKLVEAGYELADAYDLVQDEAIAAAIASEQIKTGTEEWDKLTSQIEEATSATEQFSAAQTLAATIADSSVNQQMLKFITDNQDILSGDLMTEILNNPALQQFITTGPELSAEDRALLEKFLQDFIQKEEIELSIKKLTIDGMEEIFDDGFGKAMEAFAAEEKSIQLQFDIDTADDQKLVDAAQNQIEAIRFNIDDLDAQLDDIADKEEDINEKYEDKLEALDNIRAINDDIARQAQSQLTIADALSRGDISAAAKAAQELRSKNAEARVDNQQKLLEKSRELELERITSKSGQTRKQLEEEIKSLKLEIFNIEEATLEPANERIRLAEIEKNKKIKDIEVLGRTRAEWEGIKNGIDLAKTRSDIYADAMKAALDIVMDIEDYWNDLNRTVTTTHQINEIINRITTGTTPPETTVEPPTGSGTGTTTGNTENAKRVNPLYTKWIQANNKVESIQKQLDSAVKTKDKFVKERNGYAAMGPALYQSPGLLARYNELKDKLVPQWLDTVRWTGKGLQEATLARNNISATRPPQYLASGGMASYKSEGGSIFKSLGTDTIPAMLSPGEFVVRKFAVDNFGANNLKAINSGTYSGESVYNYSVNVNVKSGANPDQIAKAVMTQIKQVDSQRMRSNRF